MKYFIIFILLGLVAVLVYNQYLHDQKIQGFRDKFYDYIDSSNNAAGKFLDNLNDTTKMNFYYNEQSRFVDSSQKYFHLIYPEEKK